MTPSPLDVLHVVRLLLVRGRDATSLSASLFVVVIYAWFSRVSSTYVLGVVNTEPVSDSASLLVLVSSSCASAFVVVLSFTRELVNVDPDDIVDDDLVDFSYGLL